jgi:hypothetical protein
MHLLFVFMFGMLCSVLHAADGPDIKASNSPYNQALKSMEAKAEQKQLAQTQQAAISQRGPEVMVIDPSIRAQDFKEAFTYLMQYKAGSPIFFELQDKEKLYNVLDISLMKGGSLMIFKINTTQGMKYRVIKVEDIFSIGND